MKKLVVLFLIFLVHFQIYGNLANNNVFFKTELRDSLLVSVKYNIPLKTVQKSNLPSFYVNNSFYKNSKSILKPNTLFFAGGDIIDEDFESSTGWTYTNAATGNKWVIGTAVNNGGTKSLYISKDGGATHSYDTKSATIVHAYKDIDIPATTEEISVSFDWKCLGEGTVPQKHFFKAWLVPDAFVPMLGTRILEWVKDGRVLLGSFNNNGTAFKSEFIGVDTDLLKGKKAKIVFEWINDTIGGWQPPAAIDNLKISTIECTKPSNIIFEDIKTDSALMKWDASAETTAKYDIYYSKDDTAPATDTIPTISGIKTTSYLLDKLDTSSNYYVWIRSVCGTYKGSWTKMYKFKTACGIVKIPFWEGFNLNSSSKDCWDIKDINKDSLTWKINTYSWNAFEGGGSIQFYNYKDTIVNDDWLISPTIKMNGTYRLKYHYKGYSLGVNEFEVLLSKEGKEIKDFKQSLVAKKMYSNTTYVEKTVILYNIVGDVNIAWHASGKGMSQIYIDNIIIEEIETCAEPMDLEVKDSKTDQATIYWKDDFGGKKWEYYVQEEGEGPPADTDSGTSTVKKEVTITKDINGDNLNSNTDYEYYVRTVCEDGKYSIWSGPFEFRTECDVLAIPFWEGFNSDSDYINCWTIIDGNEDNTFWKNGGGAFEGYGAMSFNKSSTDKTVVNDDWLISPTLKMNGTYRFKYHYKVSSSSEFEVLLSKDGTKTENFKQTLVATKTYYNTTYIEKIVILDNIVGDINIAWHANGKGNTQIYIDNVIIEEVEGCPEPMELEVKDVKTDKVTISWTDEFGAKNWEYFVQAEGKGEPTKNGTVTSKKENIATIDNEAGGALLDNTAYEFYVRTVCGGGENSIWSGPFTFKTPCITFTTPFWEGFNSDSNSFDCWKIVDVNKDKSTWEIVKDIIDPFWGNIIYAFEGDRAMVFYKSSSDSTFVNDDWLISPMVKMNGTYRLKYHYNTSSLNSNDFEVLLSKDGTETTDFKQTLVAKKTYNNEKYKEKIVILNNIVGDVNIAWHANGKGSSYIFIDNVIIEEVEGCAEPVDLDVKDILFNSATIFWTDDSGSKSWEYFVRPKGKIKGEPTTVGTVTSVKENIISTENENGGALLQNTKYEFFVRSTCDDGSNSIWSGPFEFKTDCGVFDLPFWEGFNTDSESYRCWTIIDGNKDKLKWKIIENYINYREFKKYAFEGEQAIYFNNSSSDSTFINDEWLISPTLKTTGGIYRIKYHYKTDSSYNNEFEILMSAKGIGTDNFTKTILSKKIYKNDNYLEKVVFVDNLKDEVNFAWHLTTVGRSKVYLDNVFIEKVETCPEPIELDVKDVESDKVTILWIDDFNSKSWEYFVQTIGKGEPTKNGTITSAKENIITIENETGAALLQNTVYEFYVRTVCDDGSNSIWSGPFIFKTDCDKVFDLPFWEGFNSDSEAFFCWTIIDGNNDGSTWKKIKNIEIPLKKQIFSFEGDQAMYFNKFSSDTTFVNDEWLISPTLKTNGGKYRIKYHYMTDTFNENEFEILMSTKGVDPKYFTKAVLHKQVYRKGNYVEKIVYVDNLNGDVNFAWHLTSNGSSEVFLDNIFIEKVKGCPEPNNIVITEQTDISVSIEWEQYGDGDKWEVIAVPYGEEIPEEKDLKPTIVNSDPKVTITGLDSGKVYTFYVRVICEDGTASDWSTGSKPVAMNVKANDDCSGAYNIPVNDGDDCVSFTTGTILGATLSKTKKDKCPSYSSLGYYFGGEPETDIWFEFTATSESHFLSISDIINPYKEGDSFTVALYSDDCSASDSPVLCNSKRYHFFINSHDTNLVELEIGKKYYLRIYSTAGRIDVDKVFKICITTPQALYVSPSGKDYTVEELVKDVLIDSNCDLVSNIKHQAGENSGINTLGYFNRNNTDFPYEKGIVLATHAVVHTPGPLDINNDAFRLKGKVPAWLGDPDLNEVIDQIGGAGFGSTKFVSILDFDFIPIKDSIKFEYIFAADSYSGFGCLAYSCLYPGGGLFAAWLTEIETGEGQNLALVPGTEEPIALSTVRDTEKTHAPCNSVNPEYFDKFYEDVNEYSKAPINYAGVTVPMTSEKVAVKVGKKYHIKIAIADFCPALSHASAVFFNGGSFDLGNLDLGNDMLVVTNNALCEETEVTIYSGLDKEQAAIKWYKDGVLMPGENDSKLIVKELGDYEVIGKYEFIDCEVKGSIRVEVYPKIVTEPEDIYFCENSVSTKEFIDITTNESVMLKDLNPQDYEFFYYLSKEDSMNDENRIENPTEFEIPKDKKAQEIFVRVFYKATGCSGYYSFSLVPEKIAVPESIGDQQACARYIFKELSQDQHYFSEKAAKGREYRAGDIIDKPGDYTIYICSIIGDCYEEVSFNLEITAPVKAKEFSDELMDCENYVLQELPERNRYFTESDAQGVELFPGDIIRFTQTIYVYAKSDIGPDYCTDQSSFHIRFEECPIPKGISPNGDRYNDELDLEVHGVTNIVIYNRYGMEVYSHGEGYTNQWHGQSNSGNKLPDGTYYYVVEARGKIRTGWIQLTR